MRFKDWIENTIAGAGEIGNQHHSSENGLKRAGWLRKPVPDSEKANKLFLGKHQKKNDDYGVIKSPDCKV